MKNYKNKKVLIGVSNNIEENFEKIIVWFKSFKRICDEKTVLMCVNSSEKEIKMCEKLGIDEVVAINAEIDQTHIYYERFRYILDYLKINNVYDYCLITDVFDVYFQSNPFELVEEYKNYDIFLASEGITFEEESEKFPWNKNSIRLLYPKLFNFLLDKEIICCGVLCGKYRKIIDFLQVLNYFCKNCPNTFNLKDQPSFNVLLHIGLEKNKIFNINDSWTLHCHVGGPTTNTVDYGYDVIVEKKFGGVPKMINQTIMSPKNIKYSIIHQYNRVPEWKELIEKIINFENQNENL